MLDPAPVLDEQLMRLGKWIADYYLAPLGEVFRTMLPLGAEFKRTITTASPNEATSPSISEACRDRRPAPAVLRKINWPNSAFSTILPTATIRYASKASAAPPE